MPIRPENLHRYPRDWPQISARIRFERAGGRCECTGHCGLTHPGGRCPAVHEEIHPDTGSVIGLTTAHLNHTPEDVRDENLLAACQLCHRRIDHGHHRVTRSITLAARTAAAGQLGLLPETALTRVGRRGRWRRLGAVGIVHRMKVPGRGGSGRELGGERVWRVR